MGAALMKLAEETHIRAYTNPEPARPLSRNGRTPSGVIVIACCGNSRWRPMETLRFYKETFCACGCQSSMQSRQADGQYGHVKVVTPGTRPDTVQSNCGRCYSEEYIQRRCGYTGSHDVRPIGGYQVDIGVELYDGSYHKWTLRNGFQDRRFLAFREATKSKARTSEPISR